MTDEPDKITTRDVAEFVRNGWDHTELACYRQGVDGSVVEFVSSWALIEAFVLLHVENPERWRDSTPEFRLAMVLELLRRGSESAEAQWDAELEAFLAGALGDGESDADGE